MSRFLVCKKKKNVYILMKLRAVGMIEIVGAMVYFRCVYNVVCELRKAESYYI